MKDFAHIGLNVSRETLDRLDVFEKLLKKMESGNKPSVEKYT